MIDGLSSQTIKAIDSFTIDTIGIPSMVLMERAALAVAEKILADEADEMTSYAIVCGTGNNGADGLAIGRLLFQAGKSVTLYVVGDTENGSKEFKQQLKIVKNLNIDIESFAAGATDFKGDVVIDALFGIGLNRNVEDPHRRAIKSINESKGKIIALDVPSGLSANTGEVLGVAVEAEETYTIGFMKKGFGHEHAQSYTGEITILDIGYPAPHFFEDIIKKEQTNGESI
ncbi:MAG: NAD(P)H-hydrate epimerase [Alkalibacterium sp.]|uniref:NAD(P)H-hydrate epimerase n=1 Tax=Alkalibacterium sp. TaxID=1872447 RepID=UPI003970A5B3